MSTNHEFRNRSIATVFAVATSFTLLYQADTGTVAQSGRQTQPSSVKIANGKDEPYDPGKDATDDTHGPNPHGGNPHGGDPHDEAHDSKVPANDPDRFLAKGKDKSA
jgi:hypothetical protein